MIRSTPALAYITGANGNVDRWVYVTTRADGGKLLAFKSVVRDNNVSEVQLTADPTRIPPDGSSTSLLTVRVTNSLGMGLPDRSVTVVTTAGALSATTLPTDSSGIAEVTLTSGTEPAIAAITGACEGVSGSVDVTFYNQATVEGTVTDAATTEPIEGALVADGAKTAVTDATGHYSLANVYGPQATIIAVATGHLPSSQSVTLTQGVTSVVSFSLTADTGTGYTYAAPLSPVTSDGEFTKVVAPEIRAGFVGDDQQALLPNVNPGTIVMRLDGAVVQHAYDALEVSYTPPISLSEGVHGVIITSKDSAGNDNPVSCWSFIVDSTPPVAQISSPTGGTLTGDVYFTGAVSDANLDHYLLYFEQNGEMVALAGSGETVATAGQIGSADTSSLPDGSYDLVLSVQDLAGNQSEHRLAVVLSNPHLISVNMLSPGDHGRCLEAMWDASTYVEVGYASASGYPVTRVEVYAVPISASGVEHPLAVPAANDLSAFLVGSLTIDPPETSGSRFLFWDDDAGWFALVGKAYDSQGNHSYSTD